MFDVIPKPLHLWGLSLVDEIDNYFLFWNSDNYNNTYNIIIYRYEA